MHGDSKWSNVRLCCARDRYAEPVAKIGWFGSLSRDVAGRNDVRQVNQVIEAFRRDEGRTFAADYAAAHKQYPAKGVHKQVRPAAERARHIRSNQCKAGRHQLQEATWIGGKA